MRRIDSWQDVDDALEEMGLLDIEIGVAAASLAEKLHRVISEHVKQAGPLQEERNAIEKQVNAFCLLHKDEFGKKRSKQLIFGKVAFKVSERIEIPEGMEEVIVTTLKKLGHLDCVNVKESIDKTAAKALDDNELTRCGLRRTKEDNFRSEPNLQAIAKKIGADFSGAGAKLDLEKICKLIPVPGAKEEAA